MLRLNKIFRGHRLQMRTKFLIKKTLKYDAICNMMKANTYFIRIGVQLKEY